MEYTSGTQGAQDEVLKRVQTGEQKITWTATQLEELRSRVLALPPPVDTQELRREVETIRIQAPTLDSVQAEAQRAATRATQPLLGRITETEGVLSACRTRIDALDHQAKLGEQKLTRLLAKGDEKDQEFVTLHALASRCEVGIGETRNNMENLQVEIRALTGKVDSSTSAEKGLRAQLTQLAESVKGSHQEYEKRWRTLDTRGQELARTVAQETQKYTNMRSQLERHLSSLSALTLHAQFLQPRFSNLGIFFPNARPIKPRLNL